MMEIFSDIFSYKLGAGIIGKPYIQRKGNSLGYYPVRIIGMQNKVMVGAKEIYAKEVWEVIVPFKSVGDNGRIYIPALKNHCGIESSFWKVWWKPESVNVVTKVAA